MAWTAELGPLRFWGWGWCAEVLQFGHPDGAAADASSACCRPCCAPGSSRLARVTSVGICRGGPAALAVLVQYRGFSYVRGSLLGVL